jgi:hypothetical protein
MHAIVINSEIGRNSRTRGNKALRKETEMNKSSAITKRSPTYGTSLKQLMLTATSFARVFDERKVTLEVNVDVESAARTNQNVS